MKVISSVGAKGGSGKSSVSLLLAWELTQKHKAKVALFDSDVQGTCLSAKNLNPSLPFDVLSVLDKPTLLANGKRCEAENFDYLIIDGNPRSLHEDPSFIECIAKISDLNLVISRPSPRDLRAQIKYVDLVKRATKGHIRLLWNFYQKNTGAHREGVPEGEELLGLKSIQTKIGLRIIYQDIGYSESFIGDFGNNEAAQEIRALGTEIQELLNEKNIRS
jgi:cellulose biosynthesis protein BcsQ